MAVAYELPFKGEGTMSAFKAFAVACGLLCLAMAGGANALPFTFSGSLDDPLNPNLFGSDLGVASFDDSVVPIADNVAIYTFSLAAPESVNFTSSSFASGGFSPYLSLFAGTGSTATFLASSYDDAFFGDGGDFDETEALGAGSFTVAISVFANMSFAENLGTGTLGDGFIGLGFGDLGDLSYSAVATAGTAPPPLPEPPTVALLGAALLMLVAVRRVRRAV